MTFVNRKLRLKITLAVGAALVLLLAPLNWMQYELQRRTAMRELELLAAATGSVVVHGLESAMLTNNRRTIQAVVNGVVQTPGIQTVYLLRMDGTVVASPDGAHNGEVLEVTSETCQVCHRFPVESRPRGATVVGADNQPMLRTMTPIVNKPACQRCHSAEDRLNGVFYMDFSTAELNARLEQGRRNAFWGSVAIIVVSTVMLYLLLSWLVITPLERVARGMRRFGLGQRSARVAVASQDEVGQLAGVFNEMADTIQHQEAESARLYSELESKDTVRRELLTKLITAREEEQQRLARHLHDVLGQLLTGLSLYLKLCHDAVPKDMQEVRAHLTKATAIVRDTMDQAHGLITSLRPTVLDDYGLIPALQEELNQRLLPRGIEMSLDAKNELGDLPSDVQTTAFRIVQEAVINVIRHAEASTVWVRLERQDDELVITVDDDGIGLSSGNGTPPGHRGMGILGMQERASALGGRLAVTSRQPQGTRVQLWLPLTRADATAHAVAERRGE